ncbi:MAG TPA: class I SAM-dependent methyltransferase, partial [Chthoniobacterales bacterium]
MSYFSVSHLIIRSTVVVLSITLTSALLAQKGAGDVIYEPTPQAAVDEMLRMANVGKDDFVIDLGSGDGRFVITAAKKFGARGLGVELDHYLIKQSNETAQREGIADRAKFVEEDLFKTDLSRATVLTLYLLPWMNQKLRPKILQLKPGTR